MFQAAMLSFCVGFLSLSLEILWIRLFSFTNHTLPQAFAFVLGFYLLGIAAGAYIGKRFCTPAYQLWKVSGIVLIISGLSDFLSPWVYAALSHTFLQLAAGGFLILWAALLKAIVFPVAHHLGTESSTIGTGRQISRVYVANILGATIGPIITGIILLGVFTTQECFAICAMLTILTGGCCLFAYARAPVAGIAIASFIFILCSISMLDKHKMIVMVSSEPDKVIRVIENRYGMITILNGGAGGDIIEGANVYDGRTNLDPVINSNGLNRLIILSALNDKPERVLMIGLSIGSWLKIVTSFPGVKNIDAVEINPGYLTAMAKYPRQQSGLADSRVHLYIDDGRRWLKAHPDNQYDMVIINTTYYWRTYSSNLLSYEFIKLVKQHMKPDAVLTYNTTGSPDAFKTANSIFSHAYLYENFIIASDEDWRPRLMMHDAVNRLTDLKLDNKPLFPPHSEKIILSYLHEPVTTFDQVERYFAARGRKVEVITDDNLISEYKYGERL